TVDPSDRLPHSPDQALRAPGCANFERHAKGCAASRRLNVGQIEHVGCCLPQAPMFRVADHADNLNFSPSRADETEPLANRRSVSKIEPRHRLVNDRNPGSGRVVLRGEITSLEQRNFQGPEEIGPYQVPRDGRIFIGAWRMPLDEKPCPPLSTTHGRDRRTAYGARAGKRSPRISELLVEVHELIASVAHQCRVDPREKHSVLVESGI